MRTLTSSLMSANRRVFTWHMTEVRHRRVLRGANLEIMVIIAGVDVDEGRLARICDRYGIAELQIFGSRARGTSGPDSDIDVLYTLRPGRRLGWEIEQLADELTNLFGHRVDLVSLQSLHPMLKPSVLAEARPVYAA